MYSFDVVTRNDKLMSMRKVKVTSTSTVSMMLPPHLSPTGGLMSYLCWPFALFSFAWSCGLDVAGILQKALCEVMNSVPCLTHSISLTTVPN